MRRAALLLLVVAAAIAGAQEAGLVTLNVENEEITSVLRLLSDANHINIIAGPEVEGTVSVNLYGVPFEDALRAVLGVSGYTWYRIGNIIYVTSEERKTSLPVSSTDLQVRTVKLDHSTTESTLPIVKEFMSPGGKAIESPPKSIVLQDSPEQLERITRIIHELDKPLPQVAIQVQIINVKREDNMDLGVGFDTQPFTKYGVEATTNDFAEPFPPRADALGVVDLEDLPGGTGLFAGTLQSDFRLFVEALDEVTDVEILASPQLMVMDGAKARIQVGDRLGFRITTTTDTASLESVEFLEVGTVLEVTPQISSDGLVQMEINPKVSNGSINNDGLPSENTSEVHTELMVHDGSTVIIGGLLNATKQRTRRQVPFLGDIPVLGRLFGRSGWDDNKSELVVLLTPRIMGAEPTPEMAQKAANAEQRWEPLTSQGGLASPAEPVLKENPNKKWRSYFKGRGYMAPPLEESAPVEVQAAAPAELKAAAPAEVKAAAP